VPGGLPGLPQRRDHHGEVVIQVIGATVPIPIRRERLDELAEDHQHCRGVHAAIDRDRAGMHGLVNYCGELDHGIKRVLALHNATGTRDLGSLPIAYKSMRRRIVAYRRSSAATGSLTWVTAGSLMQITVSLVNERHRAVRASLTWMNVHR